MTSSCKRLIAALAFILPAAALVTTPVMAKTKTHHTSVHKVSHHHAKKTATPTAS